MSIVSDVFNEGGSFDLSDLTKGIMDELTSGSAWNRTLEGTIGSVQTELDGLLSTVSGLPTSINGISSSIMDQISGLSAPISSAINQVAPFLSHVTSMFDNITQNLDLFASSQGLKNALSGDTGCDSMHDFFGSITQEGPSIINQFSSLASGITSGVATFTQLADTLQVTIADTRDQLISSLQAEIAQTTDVTKLADLNQMLSDVTNSFFTSVGDEREAVIQQASTLLTGGNLDAVLNQAQEMFGIDTAISDLAGDLFDQATQIGTGGSGLTDIIAGETGLFSSAVDQLVTLGAAQSVQSLFGDNKCVQTLLGYVASDSLLGKLSGIF